MQALGREVQGIIGLTVVERAAGLAISVLFGTFLTLVLMPYFMISAPRLAAGSIWLLPPERRRSVEDLLPKIVPVLRRYLIGLFLVVVYTSGVGWIGFGPLFHLPQAILLAITVGVLELVPVIGPFASATIVGLVAVQQNGIWAAAFFFAFAIGLRLLIDNVVGPLVLGQAARIHPVIVIISFVCGAILFGAVGRDGLRPSDRQRARPRTTRRRAATRCPSSRRPWSGQLAGCAASPMCDNAALTRPSPSVG